MQIKVSVMTTNYVDGIKSQDLQSSRAIQILHLLENRILILISKGVEV
jgi:hypothetical protein